MTTNHETTKTKVGQLRLALVELGRIEREIRELETRVREPEDHGLLRSLRMCRAVLIRVAQSHIS